MLIVLKYGGNAMAAPDQADPLLDGIAERTTAGDRVVLVHGGGPQIDAELARRGIATTRIGGLRVTDAATLDATESVLCGQVNKALVRALHRRGVRAAGISGQDGALLVARAARAIDGVSLEFVGEIVATRIGILEGMFVAGLVPVVAPLGIAEDGTSAYNINADTAAGAIAGALGADAFVVVTNVDRVRRVLADPATGIARLTVSEAQAYLDDGTFDGGMRPKMQSALHALASGARRAIIAGSGPHALRRALAGEGTTIVPDARAMS
ncbi:MAG: acetylglutamate kinase [Vulcanimicrobiaceae bacterium]